MALENRLLLSAYTVLNTNDSGTGSLRDAVNQANADGKADTITFDATVFATSKTITLTTGAIHLIDSGGISIVAPTVGVTISGGNKSNVFTVNDGTSASLTNVAITGGLNISPDGGGGLHVGVNSKANLSNCTVSGNVAFTRGGGIFCDNSAQLTLIDSTVSGNSAGQGGGIMAYFSTSISLFNSTVSGNTLGGGIESFGSLTMTNVTVSGNIHGGVTLNPGATGSFTNVTISGNSATGSSYLNAGGLYNRGNLTLNNSIVAGNTNASGASDIPTGFPLTAVSGSNNLIGTGGSGGLMDGNNGNKVGVANPGLGSLANNGGPTQTVALLPGSPAIHAGMDGTGVPMTDQRGVPRVGGVDIGAYQVAFSGPLVVNTTDGGNLNVPGKLTLFEAVTLANYQPGADTITFDPAVFATPQAITLTAGQLELKASALTTITAPTAGVTVSGNNASRVFQVDSGATANLNGLTITGGSTIDRGAGLFVYGTAVLTDCIVTGNTANSGAGIYVGKWFYASTGGSVTLTNTILSNNTASNSGFGGGLLSGNSTTVVMTNCTVSSNSAGWGGGIYTDGTTKLTDCTFSGNTAVYLGGGVNLDAGSATLTNVTISGNTASKGAGLINWYATTTVTNATISGNSATTNAGGVYNYAGNLTLNNTIVASNTLGGGASDIVVRTPANNVSGSQNLIGTGGSGGLVNGVNGNIVGVTNPLLSPLGNYGGPTRTIALLPGSPAINAGSNALAIGTTDQRGKSYVGTVDIGAFESQGFMLTPVTGSTPQSTLHGTAFTNPLAVTVTANNAVEPVNGGVVTYTVPGSGASAILVGNPATIASGTASVTATGNSTLGAYYVTATASGVATPASFALTNDETLSLVVNTTSDVVNPTDGLTSLREAIAYANTFISSAPTITFDASVFGSAQVITLTGGQLSLTDISEPITITAPTAGLTISGNNTSRVFQVFKNATANLNGLTITGGNAGSKGSGGGIYDYEGTVNLTNCTVTGNTAQYGGGIIVYGAGSAATLTNSIVSNNTAYWGGGAYASYGGSLTLVNCTVSTNSSTDGGGVAAYHGSSITVTNCTVSGNSGSRYGAGITVVNNSHGTLTNVTVSGNTAATGGGSGLYVLNSSTVTLNNTIVAGNTNGDITVNQVSNISGAYNLVGTGGSGGLVNGTNGNIVGVANPLLAPLGNYGGPTQTIALLPGSPAIDAGSNAFAIGTTDQRGNPYVGTVDIGAFESQGFTLTPVTGSTPQTAVTGNSFANPLGVTVTAKNPVEPVNGGLINFIVPLSGPSATLSSPSSTIAGGQASVTATANTIVGGFNAAASATGATTATFSLNNIAPLSLSGLGGTVTYVQGSSPIQVAPALVVNQNLGLNIVNATVVFTNLQVGDRIDFNNPFALQRSLVPSPDGTTATLTFTGVSSAANYQATLRTVVFSCVAANPSTAPRTATFIVTDALTNTATGSQTINVTLTNQPPLLSGIESTPLTYLANYPTYPPQVVTNSLWIFDADSNNLTRAKVQITSGYQNNSNSHDLLSFTPQFGLTSSFDSMTGTLTLTGSTSVTNYRIALRSVTFSSSGPGANGTTRTISFTAYDDSMPTPLASNTVSRNVNMQLTVAPPTLSGLNGTTTFTRGGSPVPIASTIGVNQPLGLDLGGATVKLTNLQPGDRFEFHNQFALQRSLVYSPDETSATLTLSGFATPAQYQTTLQSIIFWNVAGNLFTSPRTATFVVTDTTGQPSAPGVQYFTVAPSNQPPVLSGIEQTPLVYQGNHPEFPPQQVTSSLLVTDPDSANLTSATVKITSGYQNNSGGHDVLSFVNQNGISGLFNAATGTLTLSGLSSVSNYGIALRSVTFSTSGPAVAPGTRIVTFTAFDDTKPTPQASNQISRTVLVTTTNASPVLSGLAPVSLYVQGAPPLLFASRLQVADVDSPVLNGATISFTNWQSGDRLSFYNQFALQHTFTEDLVAHSASLTITGPTSVANYQTMLRSIGFYNVAGLPSVATRNVSIIVNDGSSNSNTGTGSINLRRL